MNLDFDTMAWMSRTNVREFDILRKKLIDRQIRRYAKSAIDLWIKRGWWTRVELDMSKSGNAVGRMVIASQKMNMKLIDLNNQLRRFTE